MPGGVPHKRLGERRWTIPVTAAGVGGVDWVCCGKQRRCLSDPNPQVARSSRTDRTKARQAGHLSPTAGTVLQRSRFHYRIGFGRRTDDDAYARIERDPTEPTDELHLQNSMVFAASVALVHGIARPF